MLMAFGVLEYVSHWEWRCRGDWGVGIRAIVWTCARMLMALAYWNSTDNREIVWTCAGKLMASEANQPAEICQATRDVQDDTNLAATTGVVGAKGKDHHRIL